MSATAAPYAQLDAWIDAHFDEQVKFLQALVQVPTDTMLTRPPAVVVHTSTPTPTATPSENAMSVAQGIAQPGWRWPSPSAAIDVR